MSAIPLLAGLRYDILGSLQGALGKAGYRLGKNLHFFAYDWRRRTVEVANALVGEIRRLAAAAGGDVDLLGLSNGGLLLRAAFAVDPALPVERVVTSGAPLGGSLESLACLNVGFQFAPLGRTVSPREFVACPGSLDCVPGPEFSSSSSPATTSTTWRPGRRCACRCSAIAGATKRSPGPASWASGWPRRAQSWELLARAPPPRRLICICGAGLPTQVRIVVEKGPRARPRRGTRGAPAGGGPGGGRRRRQPGERPGLDGRQAPRSSASPSAATATWCEPPRPSRPSSTAWRKSGTIFGHGAYLGPDFTADYIERARQAMLRYYTAHGATRPRRARRRGLQDQPLGRGPRRPRLHAGPGRGLARARGLLPALVWAGRQRRAGCGAPASPAEQTPALVAYFAWSAWVATANRPGKAYSYTNNWPPAPAVGNTLTADAVLWSTLSLIALLAGIGATLFAFGRFKDLGWPDDAKGAARELVFREPSEVRLTAGAALHRLVLPGRRRSLPAARALRRRQRPLPRRAGQLLRVRRRVVAPLPPDADLAPAARPVLRLDGLSGDRDLPRADHRGQRAAPSGASSPSCSSARWWSWSLGSLIGEALSYRGVITIALYGLVAGRAGVGVSRSRAALADRAHRRARPLARHHLPRPARPQLRGRAPRQHAVAVPLRVLSIPLFYGVGMLFGPQVALRGDRLLALLGGPSVGRGLPGDLHDRHGGLHVRAHRHGAGADGHAAHLPGDHPLLDRRRGGRRCTTSTSAARPRCTWRWGRSSRPWRWSRSSF